MSTAYLSVAEVAEHFRVSKMTIYRLCLSGELVSVRVGRGYRIPRRSYERYVAEHTTTPEPAEAVAS